MSHESRWDLELSLSGVNGPKICIISDFFSLLLSPSFPCRVDASPWVPRAFQLRVSCGSFSVTAVGQVTHLQPLTGKSPRPSSSSTSAVPSTDLSVSGTFPGFLHLLKQQSCPRLGVSSQSWAEDGPVLPEGSPALINYRLIKRSTSKSTIPPRVGLQWPTHQERWVFSHAVSFGLWLSQLARQKESSVWKAIGPVAVTS